MEVTLINSFGVTCGCPSFRNSIRDLCSRLDKIFLYRYNKKGRKVSEILSRSASYSKETAWIDTVIHCPNHTCNLILENYNEMLEEVIDNVEVDDDDDMNDNGDVDDDVDMNDAEDVDDAIDVDDAEEIDDDDDEVIQIVSDDNGSESELEVVEPPPKRRKKDFATLSRERKRQLTKELRENYSLDELNFALQSKLIKEKQKARADVIELVWKTDYQEVKKMKQKLNVTPAGTKLAPEQVCVSLCSLIAFFVILIEINQNRYYKS